MSLFFENQACFIGYFDSEISFPAGTESKKRIVDMYELEFFHEECFTTLNGTEIHLKPGSVLRAVPGDVRNSKLPFRNHFLKIPDTLSDFCNLIAQMPTTWETHYLDFYCSCISDILIGDTQQNKFRIASGFYSLFSALQDEYTLLSVCNKKTTPKHILEAVSQSIQYMNINFQNDITLSDIAASAHLSPSYFHAVFKAAQGETPQAYLTRLRIEQAKILLSTKSCEPSLIAEQCGFSSDVYFTAVFKKYMHMTPRQYRTKLMQEYWKS